FQSNGFNLSVKKVYSSDSKPSLLLLHGFNDNKETFYFIEKFLSEYFNLISFDFRGHGDSDWKKEGIYHYAESFLDVHNIAEEYCKEPFYLLGHSMGASIAARYSGLFPERILGLICLEGFIGILPKEYEKKRIQDWLSKMHRKGNRSVGLRYMSSIEEVSNRLSTAFPYVAGEKISIIAQNLTRKTDEGKYTWKSDPMLKLANPIPFPTDLSREIWKNIQAKVIILFGKNTHLKADNIEEVLSHFSDLYYIEIENAGHNIHQDQPKKLCIELEKFFTNKLGLSKSKKAW
ncbi:MAG: alpha/beta hydrolase, partial [Leptospiraceae bacterium]|nr:alpha/beta hydrolase [Leptospiraceae bacterium]